MCVRILAVIYISSGVFHSIFLTMNCLFQFIITSENIFFLQSLLFYRAIFLSHPISVRNNKKKSSFASNYKYKHYLWDLFITYQKILRKLKTTSDQAVSKISEWRFQKEWLSLTHTYYGNRLSFVSNNVLDDDNKNSTVDGKDSTIFVCTGHS